MKSKIGLYIATLGIGKWLKMAATTSGVVYLPLTYLAVSGSNATAYPLLVYLLICVAILFIGMWSVPLAENFLGATVDPKGKTRTRDQNQIVIDELLGMLVGAMPLLNISFENGWYQLVWYIGAFLCFRFFDICKWAAPGAKYFDAIERSFAVMLDDVVSGLYTGLILIIILNFLI